MQVLSERGRQPARLKAFAKLRHAVRFHVVPNGDDDRPAHIKQPLRQRLWHGLWQIFL